MQRRSDIITGVRARWYNWLMRGLGAEVFYRKVLALLQLAPYQSVLDIGCGTGTFLKIIRKRTVMPLQLMGVDASEDMVQIAQKDSSGIHFYAADAAKLSFGDETFDWVVSILAFHHMPEEVKRHALREVARVLKRSGRIIFFDLLRPEGFWGRVFSFWFRFHSYSKGNWEFLTRELARQGFRVLEEGTVRSVVGYLVAMRGI